ncbi:hypothetical protein ACHAWX_003090 [Stephanocyclus meneghinianus]
MSPPPEPHCINIAAAAASKKSSRACTECHNAKGKCVFSDDSRSQCDRCFRLNRECVPHLSRQGQRKKKANLMCANSVASAASPAATSSSSAGLTPQAPDASQANVNTSTNTRQGLLMDIIQGSQARSNNPFGSGASFLAQFQNATNANANAAKTMQQSLSHSSGPSSSGPARFQESAFNRSVLPPIEQVLSSNALANQDQDPHIALLLRQGALANLNETRSHSVAASNAVSSLLSLLQNNHGMGSLGHSSTAPFNLFGNSNSSSSTTPNHAGTNVLDALIQNARQQQVQQGLQENHLQDWQQQHQLQQIRVRHLIDQWLAHQARGGEVPQALGLKPGELHHNLGIVDQGSGQGILQILGLASNVQQQREQQQEMQDPEEEEGDCPSDCAVALKVNASLPEVSNSQLQSRLKKKKKAHLLLGTDVVDVDDLSVTGDDESSFACSSESDGNTGHRVQKRRTSNGDSSFQHVTSKRAKQDFSSSIRASQPPKDHLQPPTSLSREHQTAPNQQELHHPRQEKNISIIDSAENFCNHLLRVTLNRNMDFSSLKNHFGVQCIIREWIALAFSRRSFGYLAKASQMALKFGINMNRILSGVDEEGLEDLGEASHSSKKKEKSIMISKKHAAETKVCIGGKMNYLLAMLLEPRSVQAHSISERHMLIPHLDTSLLSQIAPAPCSTFEDMDVRGRWIIIQETCRGNTKFYCSPMIERNVMCWTHMSQIYEDNLADIFSLIFGKKELDRFQSYLARQVSLRHDEGSRTRPVHAPMMKIRLFSKRWGETDYDDEQFVVTKEMVDEVVICDFPTRHVDMMLASVQTMDKHLVRALIYHSQFSGSDYLTILPLLFDRIHSVT